MIRLENKQTDWKTNKNSRTDGETLHNFNGNFPHDVEEIPDGELPTGAAGVCYLQLDKNMC